MELTTKYRPSTFEEVLGQDATIESLKKLIETKGGLPSCLLFSGDSGIGKTTLARICASVVGCTGPNLIEVNGAERTGIDNMRDVVDQLNFIPFGKSKTRVVILDEAHRLSKQAWDSLLKPLEEPPPGTYWILCSTEPTKIPKAIQTRATAYELKKVSVAKIKNLLTAICEKESYNTDKQIIMLIAIKAEGSPRRALKYLEMAHGVDTMAKAQEIIKTVGDDDSNSPTIAMCRVIARRGTFAEAVAAIAGTEEENETIRIVATAYFTKIAIAMKSNEANVVWPLEVLNAFSKPCYPPDKLAPIILALATVLISD